MGVIVGIGRRLMQTGLAMYLIALLLGNAMLAAGLPVSPEVARMMNLFNFVGIVGGSILAIVAVGGIFVDALAKARGVALYITMFLGAVTSIAGAIEALINAYPIPEPTRYALRLFLMGPAVAFMSYYVFYQLGYLPEE